MLDSVAVIRKPAGRPAAGHDEGSDGEPFRRRLELSVGAVPWELDARTRALTYIGPQAAALFGYPLARWTEEGFWLARLIPEDRARVAAEIERAFAGPETHFEIDHRVVAADGRVVSMKAFGTVVRHAGTAEAALGFSIDVSEARATEAKLREALEEVRALTERLAAKNALLREETVALRAGDEIVGRSAPWRRVMSEVKQVSSSDATVLVLGETGTGKELVARAVHDLSPRAGRPFVAVNCAALPATLVESELFGHEKGAFTGALARKIGRFELADGGTIFLDEIGDLDAEVQTKLLRVLQTHEFERLGSSKALKVNVRVVAATHRDLERAVAEGQFRADLYYRLNVFPVRLPPLRERREDIPLLTWYFIERKARPLGKRIESIDPEVMDALATHGWPGNVRELEHVVERALILAHGPSLGMDEFAFIRPGIGRSSGSGAAPERLIDLEREHILRILEAAQWKINGPDHAAARLGMNPSTLRSRLKRLGIQRPPG